MAGSSTEHFSHMDYSVYENPPQPNERQQSKVIAFFLGHIKGLSSQETIVITDDDKHVFLQRVSEGVISDGRFDSLVKGIHTRLSTEARLGNGMMVFEELSQYPNFIQIQGMVLAGLRPDVLTEERRSEWSQERKKIGYQEILELVSRYPNPRELEKDLETLFQLIESGSGSLKIDEYRKSLRVFEALVYGKRYEYSEQIVLLKKEAAASNFSGAPRSRSPKQRWEENGGVRPVLEPQGDIPRVSDGSSDLQRLVPIRQMMVSQGKVGFEIYTPDKIRLFCIPQKPDITDAECLDVISALAGELVASSQSSGDEIDAKRLKAELVKITNVDSQSAVDGVFPKEILATRNAIYRNIVQKLGDSEFFENLLRVAKRK